MSILELIIPQLMKCGQNCGQEFDRVLDQDWNHWKLQMQSWMEDMKEQHQREGESGEGTTSGPQNSIPLHSLWSQFVSSQRPTPSTVNAVKNEPKKLVIKLDVQHFEANEISVKIVDKHVVVSARHPERSDQFGLVSRQFERRYELPEDVVEDSIVSTLTSNGVLIIEGLKKSTQPEANGEIVIPVLRETDPQNNNYDSEQQMD